MDDFILLTQGPFARQQHVRRILLECLDSVIRPLDQSDRPERKEVASIKKLLNGDGCSMATLKTDLGWLLNSEHCTVQLPESRVLLLNEILAKLPKERNPLAKRSGTRNLGSYGQWFSQYRVVEACFQLYSEHYGAPQAEYVSRKRYTMN